MLELNGEEVSFKRYPNGESMIDHDWKLPLAQGRWWSIRMRYEDDEDLIHLLFLNDYLKVHFGMHRELTMSHVPYARMDRPAEGETSFSLRSIGAFVNAMNFDRVFLTDPHSEVSQAVFDRSYEVSCMDALLTKVWLESSISPDTTTLVFPDAGAQKKYGRFIGKDTAYVVGFKHRNFDTGQIESLQLTPGGVDMGDSLNALIIDDMCSYGGTFIAAAETLRTKWGFDNVYLAVAHCEPSAHDGKLRNYVDHVYTTDSMVDETEILGRPFITRYSQDELMRRLS